ncbi:MAG: HAD hydrolase-like protein [Betaproteobacteria bacterium]|nr:HAD hydrolase-like protein [Betaproteobacteria bacterium]
MPSIAFLIFDLDGTISDPALGLGRSINYALQHFGHPPICEDQVSKFIGPPLDDTFTSITGSASREHIAALVCKYRERYAEVGYSENSLYSGVPEALHSLASSGLPLGLCTSKRGDFAERILRLFGLRQHFRFVSGGDIGIQKKHQLASLLAGRVISASSTMIGDRGIDIHAAQANALRSVGVLWGHGSLAELRAASPGALLEFPHELLQLANAVEPSFDGDATRAGHR